MTPRLFLPPGQHLPAPGEIIELQPAQRHYLQKVLRRRPGDEVLLLDGAKQAQATLGADGRLLIQSLLQAPEATTQITLLMALLKGDKMDWVVQKGTELGAARIIPLCSARSVPRLDEARASQKRDRWQRIATAAAQQSRRAEVPEVSAVLPFSEALAQAQTAPLRLLPYEGIAGQPLRAALPASVPSAIAVLIGPEGGLDLDEVDAAAAAGFVLCGLGPRILRAETAALAALAILADWTS